jgi:hypothetical protein
VQQKCRGAEVPWCIGAEPQMQRCSGAAEVQRCRSAEVLKCKGAEVQRCIVAEVQMQRCRGAE